MPRGVNPGFTPGHPNRDRTCILRIRNPYAHPVELLGDKGKRLGFEPASARGYITVMLRFPEEKEGMLPLHYRSDLTFCIRANFRMCASVFDHGEIRTHTSSGRFGGIRTHIAQLKRLEI